MAHSVYGREKADVEFNMTPMIDVTFQLIIFFILAGSFASQDLIPMKVPEMFAKHIIDDMEIPNKVVVNLPGHTEDEIKADESLKGKIRYWKVRTEEMKPKEAGRRKKLLDILTTERNKFKAYKKANPGVSGEFEVYLRAEGSVNSGEVLHVLGIIKEAGFAKVYYVAASKQKAP